MRHIKSTELSLVPIRRDKKDKKNYDGGFHLQPATKREKCAASKRSSVQEFTFR